jgi:preprotein translocase SecE subunit
MSGIIAYFKHVRAEMTHVVWPNPRTAAWHTLLIVIISGLVGGFIAVLDYGFTTAVTYLIGAY